MTEQTPDEEIEDLPDDVDPEREDGDHPETLTQGEIEAGLAMYRDIDDHDDHSNGIDR